MVVAHCCYCGGRGGVGDASRKAPRDDAAGCDWWAKLEQEATKKRIQEDIAKYTGCFKRDLEL